MGDAYLHYISQSPPKVKVCKKTLLKCTKKIPQNKSFKTKAIIEIIKIIVLSSTHQLRITALDNLLLSNAKQLFSQRKLILLCVYQTNYLSLKILS